MQHVIIIFSHYNETLCKLRLKGKYNKITLISGYAPTEEKDIELKEQFYEDLQKSIDTITKSDTISIFRNFNFTGRNFGRKLNHGYIFDWLQFVSPNY